MTSQTFSNKNKPFAAAFSLAPVSVSVGLLVFCLLAAVLFPWDIRQLQINSPDILYVFAPTGYSPSGFNALLSAFVIAVSSVLMSLLMFGFISNKRASAAYLGLPVRRGRLFLSRYLAGLALLLAPNFIIFAVMLYSNIAVFGATAKVFEGFVIVFGATVTLTLTVYSVMTAVSVMVGTMAESIFMTLVILILPLVILMLANNLPSYFLYGSSFGQGYNFEQVAQTAFPQTALRYWFPISAVAMLEQYKTQTVQDVLQGFIQTGGLLAITVSWVLISACASLFARFMFIRIKAENSGALGTNRVMNGIVSVTVSLCCAVIYIGQISHANYSFKNVAAGFAVAFAFSFLVFLVCRFLLTLSLKKALAPKGLRPYGVVAIVFILSAVYGLTGGLGYGDYQPKQEEIASAHITYLGAPDFIVGEGETFGNFYEREKNGGEIFVRDYREKLYTNEETEEVLALHKKLIDAGAGLLDGEGERIKLQVVVEYDLKNGERVGRFYKTIPSSLAEEILAAQEGMASIQNKTGAATALSKEFYAENPDAEDFMMMDKFFSKTSAVPAEHKLALLDALQKDIDSLSFGEKYYPKEAAHAVLCMPRFKRTENGLQLPGMSHTSFAISSLSEMAFVPETEDVANFLSGPSTEALRFYITDGYVNTLAYLRENNLCDWMPDGEADASSISDVSDISSLRFAKYNLFPKYATQSLYFRSFTSFFSDSPMTQQTPSGVTVILAEGSEDEVFAEAKEIPPDRYGELLSLARTHYFADEGGYLLYAQTNEAAGTKRVTLFLPEEDAPDWLN